MEEEKYEIQYETIKIDKRALDLLKLTIELSDEINSYKEGSEPSEESELLSKLIIKEFDMVDHVYKKYKSYVEENGEDSYRKIVNYVPDAIDIDVEKIDYKDYGEEEED